MKDESIRRFISNRSEMKGLITGDLAKLGIAVQGESKVTLLRGLIAFEIAGKAENKFKHESPR